jgi:autotransporter-associated beta strand protein
LSLQSANTYTGVTYISDGNVGIGNAEALGDTNSGTIVAGGFLSIGVPNVIEPIRVLKGGVILDTDVHAGPITLSGGEITTRSFLGGVHRTLASPLEIDGAGTLTTNDENMILDGGVIGRGLIRFSHTGDNFILNGLYAFSGEVIFDGIDELVVNTPMTVLGKAWFDQGTIVANEDVVLAGGLHSVHGARLVTAPGKTITINTLDLAGTYIDAELIGPTSLTLNQGTGGTLQRLSDRFDGDINVTHGVLNVTSGAGLGSTAGGTYIDSVQNAVLFVHDGALVDDNIYLNNSKGYSSTGGLLVSGGTATIRGGVDLGDIGSYIGNTRGRLSDTRLELAGPISGGSLTKIGLGATYITGNSNTYTGQTIVRQGQLYITDEGDLTTTSGVRIEGPFNEFIIDNSGTENLPNRIADHIPFELAGGNLALQAKASATTTETIGHVLIHSGHSLIEARPASNANSVLTLSGLSRNQGATVDFSSWPGNGREVHIIQPPPLDDGILGGWATVYGENFATLASGAVASLTTGAAEINATGPTSNVRLNAPGLMDVDSSINSLWMSNDVNNLDLGGHTLTIESGGILGYSRFSGSSQPVATIDNGRLTSSTEMGELILHGRLQVLADIVDTPGGSIGVTAAGGLNARINLAGTNSYTGPTTVTTSTRLTLSGLQSVPVNNDVHIMGGEYLIHLNEAATVQLGELMVDLNGYFLQSGPQVTIDAESYDLRAGTLEPKLVGSGAITKSTTGTVALSGDNSQYDGDIVINEGTLAPKFRNALGKGAVTVNPDGRLGFASSTNMSATGPIRLNGGELSSIVGSTFLVSDIHVLTDSTIHTARINDTGGIVGADIEFNGLLIGDANLLVTGSINGELTLSGDTSGFTGGIIVDGSQLFISNSESIIDGLIDARNGSGVSVLTSTVPIQVRLEDSAISVYQAYPALDPYVLHGSIAIAGDSVIRQYNDATCHASITLERGSVLRKRQIGTVTFSQDVLVGEDTMVVVHEGMIRFDGTLRSNAPAASIDLISANAAQITGSIDIQSSQSLMITINGEMQPLELNTFGQMLSGNGTLGNSLILGPGAVIAPGASAGVLTVDGDYTQLLDAVMRMELGGAEPGAYDRLVVTGLFDAGGVFELLLLDGFVPDIGDVFDVLDFNALVPASMFDQMYLPELGPGRAWDTSALLTTGEVRVVPEPCTVIVIALSGFLLRRHG